MSASNFTTYDQIGLKEDVSDIISDISPTDTPVLSTIGSDSIHNPLFEWQEDELSAVNPDNAAIEGADASDADQSPTTMIQNRSQIFTKTVKVSGTSQESEAFGRSDELTYQIEKKGKEIKRDMEAAAIGRVQAPVAGSDSVARKTGSLLHFIDPANQVDAGGSVDEDSLMLVLENIYTEGGEPSLLLTHPKHAIAIADFATATSKNRQRDVGSDLTLVRAIDFMVTPFGELTAVLDRFMSDDHIVAFDPDMAEHCVLRPVSIEELAKTGDSDKYQLVGESGFKVNNAKAHGFITNLSV